MQKPIGSPKMKTTPLCIPRLMKSNKQYSSCTNKNKPLISPMTLLERFREAVLRLIMLSAVSNKSNTNQPRSTDHHVQQCTYCPYDPHHSEAVADCIEFIKKKASPEDDHNRGSSVSIASSSIAADLEAIIYTSATYVT